MTDTSTPIVFIRVLMLILFYVIPIYALPVSAISLGAYWACPIDTVIAGVAPAYLDYLLKAVPMLHRSALGFPSLPKNKPRSLLSYMLF